MISDLLVGRMCDQVTKHEFSWSFRFGDDCTLSVECPWRCVTNSLIVVSSGDHEQTYGLSEPVNAELIASSLLSGKTIIRANGASTGDLTVDFEGDVRLEVFNDSSGYESWMVSTSDVSVVGRNEGE